MGGGGDGGAMVTTALMARAFPICVLLSAISNGGGKGWAGEGGRLLVACHSDLTTIDHASLSRWSKGGRALGGYSVLSYMAGH